MYPEWIGSLPTVNAVLNCFAALLIIWGVFAVKIKKSEVLHKKLMISGVLVSSIFLLFYLIYHYFVGSVPFTGTGWIRGLYFTILIPHIILAALVLPLILLAIYFALADNKEKHKKIVHWAFPIWIYVSLSGVAVYVMLYHLTPQAI